MDFHFPLPADLGPLKTEPFLIDVDQVPAAYSYSDTQYEIIKEYIQEFEESLDDEHEVGVMLTNFGHSVTMQVTEISYEKSVLMIFRGYVNGVKATLIQHVSQLNFLLTSVPKESGRPKRRIGFLPPGEE